MTRARKRQRENYQVVDWQPLLQETELWVNGKRTKLVCRVAVVQGDVLQWVKAQNRFGVRLVVTSQPRVHGYWLPARVVLHSSRARYVVHVDLVAHTTPKRHAQEIAHTRQVLASGNARALARPATWSRLYVDDATPWSDSRVVHATHLTDRYRLLVTRVTVEPLPNVPGRRGQHALDRALPVVPGDLLRHALHVAQFFGTTRPARKTTDVGLLSARRDPVPPQRRQRAQDTQPTPERHRVVRDLCLAAPYGERTQVVVKHFGCHERTAAKYVRQSQVALRWGLAHERSKGSRKSTKKGSKA